MKLRLIATAGIAASLAIAPVERVQADAGDAIAGAIIGGILSGALGGTKTRKKTVKKSGGSSYNSAQRQTNKDIQTALNYFGYNVGTPDGAIGPKSRSAISEYQALLGYPATGQLTEVEQNLLLAAHTRALAGGAIVMQTVSAHPMGVKGLLIMQRDEMAGITTAQVVGVQPGVPQMAPMPTLPGVTQPVGVVTATVAAPITPMVPVLPVPDAQQVVAAPTAALPSFMGSGVAQESLASHCNKISLVTSTNGGYTSVAILSDPSFALSEQFCLARTYAMSKGEELQAQIAGFTPQQIAEQCAGFGPLLAPHVATLGLKRRDAILADLSGFINGLGMAPGQLAGTARICLGVGYTTDAMDLAMGSALLLTALGESAYGELIGHHIGQGFGVAPNSDAALEWYETAVAAMQAPGGGVFAPGLAERPILIRKAAYAAAGRSEVQQPSATLPQFALTAPTAKVPQAPVVHAPPALRPSAVKLSKELLAPRQMGNGSGNGG